MQVLSALSSYSLFGKLGEQVTLRGTHLQVEEKHVHILQTFSTLKKEKKTRKYILRRRISRAFILAALTSRKESLARPCEEYANSASAEVVFASYLNRRVAKNQYKNKVYPYHRVP